MSLSMDHIERAQRIGERIYARVGFHPTFLRLVREALQEQVTEEQLVVIAEQVFTLYGRIVVNEWIEVEKVKARERRA